MNNLKRDGYISWDQYFMSIALLSKERSKDPNTQVGACIVSHDNRVLSLGYNGAPMGIDDNDFPWSREGDFLNTKYAYVCHAELNAILNFKGSARELENSKIYVSLFPCNECAKALIQSGIKTVIYYSDKYKDSDVNKVAKRMFDKVGVEYIEYKKTDKNLEIEI